MHSLGAFFEALSLGTSVSIRGTIYGDHPRFLPECFALTDCCIGIHSTWLLSTPINAPAL
jgi:hypothetical protein